MLCVSGRDSVKGQKGLRGRICLGSEENADTCSWGRQVGSCHKDITTVVSVVVLLNLIEGKC